MGLGFLPFRYRNVKLGFAKSKHFGVDFHWRLKFNIEATRRETKGRGYWFSEQKEIPRNEFFFEDLSFSVDISILLNLCRVDKPKGILKAIYFAILSDMIEKKESPFYGQSRHLLYRRLKIFRKMRLI